MEKLKRISIDVPESLVLKIDSVCKQTYITRRKWFIDAAQMKLSNDQDSFIDMIVKK